jgi:hypothetical protein
MRPCALVIMDAAPLIYFAAVKRLDLLLAFSLPVWIPDEVWFEATEKHRWIHGKEGIGEKALKAFAKKHVRDAMVKIVQTYTGASAKRDRQAGRLTPQAYPAGLGEQSAHSVYLGSTKRERPAVFLYNDEDASNLFRAKRLDVQLLTPYALLRALEREGKIPSAEGLWDQIASHFRGIAMHEVDESLRGDSEYRSRLRKPR